MEFKKDMFEYVRGAAAAPKKPSPHKHTLREQVVLKIMRLSSALHRWRALQETMRLKAFVGALEEGLIH